MMNRILVSTVTLGLVAFAAVLLFGRQESAAGPDLFESAAFPAAAADDAAPADKTSTRRTIRVPRTKTVTVYEDVAVETAGVTSLQQQYSALMLKRAQRMNEEDLKEATEELKAELKEQDQAADAELQKAVEILHQLQETSVGTPAARRATEALPVLTGPETAKPGGGPFYNPSDDAF